MSGGLEAAGGLPHLIRRFVGSIRPGSPSTADEQWARQHLLSGEQALWEQMSNPDRRHAVGVARCVATTLGPQTPRPVIAAALLHDVGKVDSGLRTPGRVAATLFWAAVPTSQAAGWSDRRGPLGSLARYRLHPEIGERLLEEAGADPLTSQWAADHHRPTVTWRASEAYGRALKACDDD